MSIMKNAFKRINVLYLIIALLIAACVNKIGDEIKEGNIPISFSVKTSKTTTKAAKSTFETGDRTGVFAMLTGSSLDKQRYIDNLLLECGEGSKLIPKKEVYYPECHTGFHQLLSVSDRKCIQRKFLTERCCPSRPE